MTSTPPPFRRMRLRYAGTCRGCGIAVASGQWAVYHHDVKQVECVNCAESPAPAAMTPHDAAGGESPTDPSEAEPLTSEAMAIDTIVTEPEPIEPGTAGASARREHQRRVANREERIRTRHPRLGGFILAVTDEPQSTTAWATGARGEELLAKRLDRLADQGVLLLHDRRIPPSRANIDHIAISPAGVFVIDAKRYKGRPHLRVQGGLLRPRTETLMVGSRDCTKLVTGVTKQVDLVRAAITAGDHADVPIRGMLCFVQADWPLIGGSFTTGGIDVLWPTKATEKITAAGPLSDDQVIALHRQLAHTFPPA
jgi:hypothetical protein